MQRGAVARGPWEEAGEWAGGAGGMRNLEWGPEGWDGVGGMGWDAVGWGWV